MVGVEAVAVDGVRPQVGDVDLPLRARDEGLQLAVAEHEQPVEVDDVAQSLAEGDALSPDLPVQLVVGD